MEGLIIRRWDAILPGFRWLYEPPPISDQRWGWGCHTLRGGIDPGITMFVPSWLERCIRRRIYDPVMGPYPPRLPLAPRTPANRRSSGGIGASTLCRVPLAPRTPANQRSASEVGASTPCREVSIRGITVSFPVRWICRDGRVSVPEMGSYPPRVRRLALRTSANERSINQWGWAFHTVRDGIDRRDYRFRPWFGRCVDVWKD